MAKGALLIGYGSQPTKADVDDALKSGWIKNCSTVSTTSFPASTKPTQELHFSTYIITRMEKGWEDPGGLQAMKITTTDGRTIYGVYPLAGGQPRMSDEEAKARILDYHKIPKKKKWWQFWK